MVPKSTQLASCGPPGRFYCDFGAKSMGPLSPPPTSSGGTGSLFCVALDLYPNSHGEPPERALSLGS